MGAPLGGRRCILSAIMLTPRNNRPTIKMKMRRLQPARRPSEPIKILRRTDACGGTDCGGKDSGGPLPGSGAERSIESFKGSLLGYSSIYADGYSEVPSSRMAPEFRQLERIFPVSPSIGRRIRALRATSTDRSDWCWHSTARALACCRSSTQMTPDRPRLDLVQGTLGLLIGPHRSALPTSATNKVLPVSMACG